MLLLHPLDVPTGKAIGVGLLWYGMTLVVSLLGAPAFAVGHRHDHDGRRRRRRASATQGPETRHTRIMSVVEEDVHTGRPSRPRSVPLHRRLPGGRTLRDGHRLYWWGELLAVAIFYFVYSFVRNLHHGNEAEAYQHALDLIRLQKSLGINHEQAIQAWALGSRAFIIACNYFYGSLHFIVTGGVMIYLYRRWTDDYPRWRNTLAIATGLALIGFAFFPLLPPRLLADFSRPRTGSSTRWPRTPRSGRSTRARSTRSRTSSRPCRACTARGRCGARARSCRGCKHVWAKVLAAIYPVTTVTVIVVTANHYFLDAVGGFFVLGRRLRAGPDLHPGRTRTGRADRARARDRVDLSVSRRLVREVAAHEEAHREADEPPRPRSRGSSARSTC